MSSVNSGAALVGVAGLSLWMVLPGVFAQAEQWLQYHTAQGSRGYSRLVTFTNPPPNLILPKLQGQPLFARWYTPMDASGFRWMCFDRTGKRSTYDTLFMDLNGNGRLDDDAPLRASSGYGTASFGPARVVFQTGDGPVTYHLVVVSYGSRGLMYARSACWYEGTVDFGGRKLRVQLFDNNVNGAFDDIGYDTSDTDLVVLAADQPDESRTERLRYLGRFIEVDGQLFQIEVARDGAFVKVEKARAVRFGTVKVPETISEFVASGKAGHFTRNPARGTFILPVGTYQIQSYEIVRNDAQGVTWKLGADDFGSEGWFTVTDGETTELHIGEPVYAVLDVREPGKARDPIVVGLRLEGGMKETITIFRGRDRGPAPKLSLLSADGSYRKVSSFQYG